MKRSLLILLFAWCCSWTVLAQPAEHDFELTEAAQLPFNLHFPRGERAMLEKLWRRSATFRQQCAAIAAAHWLTIELIFTPKPDSERRSGALTVMYHAKRLATVRIFSPGDLIRLLGHEFEHVREFIEGVNLNALVAANDRRAYRTEQGYFETQRAVQAGLQVRDEYDRAKRRPLPVEAIAFNTTAPF